MTRKPTISFDDRGTIEQSSEDLARPFVMTDSLLAADAEMATDSDAEAEAEQRLGAVSVGVPLDDVIVRWPVKSVTSRPIS
jgi:hypothetical protein